MPAVPTTPKVPDENSRPQHLMALARANRVRLARAELKRRVGSGKRTVVDVVVNCPFEAESMSISELLSSQRHWGRARSRKFLSTLSLSENKPIGTLTERQRLLLASALRSKMAQSGVAPAADSSEESGPSDTAIAA